VVFYGSSSIRLWDTLAEDFPDLPVVNAGFGGSTLLACSHFFGRLIGCLEARSLLLYAGDNDLGDGRSPRQVLIALRSLLWQFDARFPGVRFGFLSIKPSPARWHLRQAIREANGLARAELSPRPNSFYVDLVPHMLGENGQPRPEFYAPDGLHLSAAGYRLWKEVVGSYRNRFE
jgi:lysophospholipase L1-like esterase